MPPSRELSQPLTVILQYSGSVKKLLFYDLVFSFWVSVRPDYSCSLWKIDRVKAMDGWEFNNVAGFCCSCGTTVRHVAIQHLVRSPRMAAIRIRRHKGRENKFLEVSLDKHYKMGKKFSA